MVGITRSKVIVHAFHLFVLHRTSNCQSRLLTCHTTSYDHLVLLILGGIALTVGSGSQLANPKLQISNPLKHSSHMKLLTGYVFGPQSPDSNCLDVCIYCVHSTKTVCIGFL